MPSTYSWNISSFTKFKKLGKTSYDILKNSIKYIKIFFFFLSLINFKHYHKLVDLILDLLGSFDPTSKNYCSTINY